MTDKGHPHADLMLLYAQNSKTNAEEWRNWEYKLYGSVAWAPALGSLTWHESTEYRRKPEPMVKYGVVSNGAVLALFDNREDLNAWFACSDKTDLRVIKLVEVPE